MTIFCLGSREEARMKSILSVIVLVGALTLVAADALAMNGHGRRHGDSAASSSESYTGGSSASVPEPSLMYAVGSGLAVLAGAGWYIRRRK
jgi:hypothetical protein